MRCWAFSSSERRYSRAALAWSSDRTVSALEVVGSLRSGFTFAPHNPDLCGTIMVWRSGHRLAGTAKPMRISCTLLRQPLHVEELAESRWLILGPDRAANILEIIIYVTDQGDERIIHAMRATDENLRYL